MLNSTLNSSMRGVVVSPANLCRGPCYKLVQNFPSEFLLVELGDIKDDPPDVLDRGGCGGL